MDKPDISCVTITNRPGGVDITWSSLRRQTYENFEWVYCDTLYAGRKMALQEYTKNDPRVVHIQQSPKGSGAKTWLAHAENQGVRQARGELIVFLQDYIHIEPDALIKFWLQYRSNPKCFVSGVGNQYGKPGVEDVVDKEGMITIFKEPFEKKPEFIVWYDPRIRNDMGSFYKCMPQDWEVNFAACPAEMMYDVGGFDEEYDNIGFAWDNVSVAQRAFALGYEPYLDQSNQSFTVHHEKFFSTGVKYDNWQDVAHYHDEKMKKVLKGEIPIKYPYLDKK